MKRGLKIVRWSFWSPEDPDPIAWRDSRAVAPMAGPRPKAPDDAIPPAHRRRMSSLSKLAVQTALKAAGDSQPDFAVFCSQHGDMTRLREMLRDIAAGAELSPATFSQSVHNASAGMYTIISGNRAPVTSLASGGGTFASGWLEAEGFLVAQPDAQVLLVCYDEELPPEYATHVPQAQCVYAVGLLLRMGDEGDVTLSIASAERDEPLPMAPLFLAWMLSGDRTLRTTADGRGWVWTRDSH